MSIKGTWISASLKNVINYPMNRKEGFLWLDLSELSTNDSSYVNNMEILNCHLFDTLKKLETVIKTALLRSFPDRISNAGNSRTWVITLKLHDTGWERKPGVQWAVAGERPVGLSLWQTATGANWHLRGLGKRVQFLVFGLLCKLSVKLAVIKKKKKSSKREIKKIVCVCICFCIA